MSYYPEPERRIRDKVKDLLDLLSYSTKKEVEYVTGIGTSDLAANDLDNVPSSLNNAKIKIDDLHVTKLQTVPIVL